MKKILTILTILIVGLSIAFGQSGNKQIESEMQKLNEEYSQAINKRDVAAIGRLTTDDFLATTSVPAVVRTKAEFIERLKGSEPSTYESRVSDDLKFRVHGNTVITTGRGKSIGKTPDGKPRSAEVRWTDVWVKQNGKWLLAASHVSPADGVFKRE